MNWRNDSQGCKGGHVKGERVIGHLWKTFCRLATSSFWNSLIGNFYHLQNFIIMKSEFQKITNRDSRYRVPYSKTVTNASCRRWKQFNEFWTLLNKLLVIFCLGLSFRTVNTCFRSIANWISNFEGNRTQSSLSLTRLWWISTSLPGMYFRKFGPK